MRHESCGHDPGSQENVMTDLYAVMFNIYER